jgi:hypothetical protein
MSNFRAFTVKKKRRDTVGGGGIQKNSQGQDSGFESITYVKSIEALRLPLIYRLLLQGRICQHGYFNPA